MGDSGNNLGNILSNTYNRQTSLGMLSGKIHALMKRGLQRQLDQRKIPLKVEFYPVINRLLEQDGVSQQTIADWIGYDRARTSRMIDELETAGLVIRKDDPESRRTKLICLSDYTKGKRTDILDAVQDTFEIAFTGFSSREKSQIIKNLQQIRGNLEKTK